MTAVFDSFSDNKKKPNISFFYFSSTIAAIYQNFMLKNADRTNKIITAIEKWLILTDFCLWKHPNVVPIGVKTRSETKDDPTVDYTEVDE